MANHVSLAFAQLKDPPLANFALGVHDGLGANPTIFTNIPAAATLVMLKAATDDFNAKLVAATRAAWPAPRTKTCRARR